MGHWSWSRDISNGNMYIYTSTNYKQGDILSLFTVLSSLYKAYVLHG
jgi:hypothetical protein